MNAEIEMLLLSVFGERTLSRSKLYKWIGCVQRGREVVLDDKREGHLKMTHMSSVVARIKMEIDADHWRTLKDVASVTDVSHESVKTVLRNELNMSKVSLHFIPHFLSSDQKSEHVRITEDSLLADETGGILSRLITGDENSIFEYDPAKKRCDMVWLRPDELCVKKALHGRSKIKAHIIVFFNCQGILLIHWVLQGKTVTRSYYLTVIQKMRDRLRKKQPVLWHEAEWLVHHNIAGSYQAFMVKKFLAHNGTVVFKQPPYSPNFDLCDFWLFDMMRGDHLGSIEAI